MASKVLGIKWPKIRESLAALSPDLASYIERFAYGEVYARPGLGLRERELVSVTCLTLAGLWPQLKSHVHGALNVGVSRGELIEVFLHIALYAGFPTALAGLTVAKEVFDARAGARARLTGAHGRAARERGEARR
jgi:4-carboxymuconolactone decarboxylase